MTGQQNIVRGLVTYGSILPVALILGYLLATPLRVETFAAVGLVAMVLTAPLLLRWHHAILFLSWNMTAVVFLPGRPQLWLVMAFVSFGITVLQYILTRRVQFVHTRSVLYPLVFLGAVTVVTAFATGGIGLSTFGGSNVGGRRYIFLFAAILGYIAMTAHRIPPNRALLFVGLFLLGALTNAIGTLLPFTPKALYPIFSVFPVEKYGISAVVSEDSVSGVETFARFGGFTHAFSAVALFLVAKHGMKQLLDPRKWAFWIWMMAIGLSTVGGYRSHLLVLLGTMTFCFFMDGLHRSRKMPALLVGFLLFASGIVAISDRLPLSMQRSLSFLPLRLDPMVRMDAEGTTEWRLEIWKDLLPVVPDYLLLGKGLSMNAAELEMVTTLQGQGRAGSAERYMLSGDYHNGPLSVIIPFGIWGFIGWLWFVAAGLRALYLNCRNSPPELRNINTLLFAYFLAKTILFFVVFGGFYKDLAVFGGILGLSVCLNNGIRQPVPGLAQTQRDKRGPGFRPRLVPSFSNHLPR